MRGKQKGFISLHIFLYLVLVLRAGLQPSVGQFWPVDRRFDVPAVACSHGNAACLTVVFVVQPQQPVRCLKDLKEQRVSALMWLTLPPSDRGTVQKVIVLPSNGSLHQDLILEELEVFQVSSSSSSHSSVLLL